MGAIQSNRKPSYDVNGQVNFDHFQILRAIGKGAFGKVCIVQKKDTKAMYAMKYMNKYACLKKDAVRNVLRELDILQKIEHPFIVNLWFAFQDEEDMFMVVDLLLGGDIRYHLQQGMKVNEQRVQLYISELGLALGYLREKRIIHRDVKPDNVLLDEKGHVHLTDFNIATVLEDGTLATSMSGTKPYMAPEIFQTACNTIQGYGFSVDWWSLGVCAYEMLRGRRPYEIHANTGVKDVIQMFSSESIYYPQNWSKSITNILQKLLQQDPRLRLASIEELKQQDFMASINWTDVFEKKIKPSFVPPKDHLNCDPTYELEEMIIESKPLHKKKKRLAKMSSKIESNGSVDPMQASLDEISREFKIYNRENKQLCEAQEDNQDDLNSSSEEDTIPKSEATKIVKDKEDTIPKSHNIKLVKDEETMPKSEATKIVKDKEDTIPKSHNTKLVKDEETMPKSNITDIIQAKEGDSKIAENIGIASKEDKAPDKPPT